MTENIAKPRDAVNNIMSRNGNIIARTAGIQSIDVSAALDYLALLGVRKGEPVWFQTLDGGKPPSPALNKHAAGSIHEHASFLSRKNSQGAGVFIAVNEIIGEKRTKENVGRIRAVFCECDDGMPDSFPIEPTFVVQTSPGKAHCYFVCGGLSHAEFEGVMARMVQDYKSDPNAKDTTRLLRLPGSWHTKDPANPHLVRIVERSGNTYTRDEVLSAFPPVARNTQRQVDALKASTRNASVDPAVVEDALRAIPADCGYSEWCAVGMALHHAFGGAPLGLELFDKWSQSAPAEYDPHGPNSPAEKWKSFDPDKAGAVTIATVFARAKKNGWERTAPCSDGEFDAEVERLANLHPATREIELKIASAFLGVRLKTLEEYTRKRVKEIEERAKSATLFRELPPWDDPVDGAQLLDEIVATMEQYVVLSEHSLEAAALWIMMAHVHDAVHISPILAIQSPEKRCGKTTMLLLAQELVPKALSAANISTAAVFRAVEKYGPTLLIDEADTFMKDNSDMRGVINGGHNRRSARVVRCVGDDNEAAVFSTWCPKVISGINNLPDTLQDRSIVIRMRRKTPEETVKRFRSDAPAEFERLNRMAVRWAQDSLDDVRGRDAEVPSELNDRAADNWRPMLAVADSIGGDWPQRARAAAIELSKMNEEDVVSYKTELLKDIRAIFAARQGQVGARTISSSVLVSALHALKDADWGDYYGKAISAKQVAKLLGGYGVKVHKTKAENIYREADFQEAWGRYLKADAEPEGAQATDEGGALAEYERDRDALFAASRRKVMAQKLKERQAAKDDLAMAGLKVAKSVEAKLRDEQREPGLPWKNVKVEGNHQ